MVSVRPVMGPPEPSIRAALAGLVGARIANRRSTGPEHSNISDANEISGRQTGSQRPQAPGPVRTSPALSLQLNGASGHAQYLPGTLRKCLLSCRSRVRRWPALRTHAVRAQRESHSCVLADKWLAWREIMRLPLGSLTIAGGGHGPCRVRQSR